MTGYAGSQGRESTRLSVLVTVLLFVLVLLAAFQYRWLGQVSEAERTQMREFLKVAAGHFCQEFNNEVSAVYDCFRPEPGAAGFFNTLRPDARYKKWASSTQFPRLIKDVWLVPEPDGRSAEIQRLMPMAQKFQPSPCPPDMDRLRGELGRRYQQFRSISVNRGLDQRLPPGRFISPVSDDPPALIIPIIELPSAADQSAALIPVLQGFVVVTLNMDTVRNELLPALATRYFASESGSEYQISVVRRQNPKIVIFRTGPQPAPVQGESEAISEGTADFTAGFFSIQLDRPSGAFSAASGFTGLRTDESQGEGKAEGSDRLNGRSLSLGPWIFGGEAWEMRIQHRSGSLAAAVSAGRRRNLAVSFGILLLLCASVIAIVISTRRAHSLAQRQIEFVAAVSHELRTPLTVISTAAQNLADGIVEGKKQTREYGAHIGTESVRLGNMIEKILEFARGQSRAGALHLAPVRIRDLADSALSAVQQQVLAGGFEIKSEIQSDLQTLLGDEPSLRRALQNLLDNAMKYSGGSHRIRLTAQGQQGRKGTEILVSVQDYGIGIPKEELTLVFDPFFRGKEAVSNNINGSGLGLSLVKSIVSAHRGRMLIDSRPGEGTTISLVLPAAPPEED